MKMSEKDFKSLSKGKKKKPRTCYDRLNEAVKTGFDFKNDKIILSEKSIVLNFKGVALLSHNDILRIKFDVMYRYIKLWKERVAYLVEQVSLNEWEKNKVKKLKIEFLYTTKNKQCLDYDSTIGAVKFVIDGLTESSVIFDDSIEFVPVVLSRQKQTKEENSLIVVITPIEEQEYEKYFSEEFKKLV